MSKPTTAFISAEQNIDGVVHRDVILIEFERVKRMRTDGTGVEIFFYGETEPLRWHDPTIFRDLEKEWIQCRTVGREVKDIR
jgi:hypothetical protein